MHKISINGPKKTEDTSSIKYFFLSTENYEQSGGFLNQVFSNIEAVKGTLKLHAVFPHEEPNKIWVINMSCICQKCFNDGFMPESTCKGWRVANLRKLNNGFGSNNIILEVDEYVAAVYDRNVYLGKTIEVDESEVHAFFFQYIGKIEKNSVFRMSKKEDQL